MASRLLAPGLPADATHNPGPLNVSLPRLKKIIASREATYEEHADGTWTVWVWHDGVDVTENHGVMVKNAAMADRLGAAINDGACVKDEKIMQNCYGDSYVSFRLTVNGRMMNADLNRIGY